MKKKFKSEKIGFVDGQKLFVKAWRPWTNWKTSWKTKIFFNER